VYIKTAKTGVFGCFWTPLALLLFSSKKKAFQTIVSKRREEDLWNTSVFALTEVTTNHQVVR